MRLTGITAFCFALAATAGAQGPPPAPPAPAATVATVSYGVDSPQRDPAKFTVSINLVGHAVYTATDRPDPDASGSDDDTPATPYRVEFDVSSMTRERVFALAQQLDYFHGDYEFRKHKVSDTGQKTLRYHDPMRDSAATFHWSENKQIQELSGIFEGIALTQALARKVAYLQRFDKLGLEDVLKRMEELDREHYLLEIQSIAPTLRLVANDPSVMHVARERAARFLDQISAQAVPPPNPPRQ